MSCNNSGTQSAQKRENNSMMMRKLEAPSTPGRPFFSFSVSRKSVPSKWDDAEKWLFNGGGSCNESPAHQAFTTSNNDNKNNNRPICLTDVRYREGDMCATFTTNNHYNHNNVVKQSEFSSSSNSKEMINEVMVLEQKKITEVTHPKFINWSNASDISLEDHHKQQQQQLSSSITFNGVIIPADFPLKDKYTDEIGPFITNFGYSEPAKEAFMFKSHNLDHGKAMADAYTEVIPIQKSTHRDVGTEMTPLGSNTTSRCNTPLTNISPVRHNTPASLSGPLALTGQPISSLDMVQLQECHFAKFQIGSTQFNSVATNWSSREEEEEDISKSLRHFEIGRSSSVTVNETRVSWEEEEKTKFCLRYQREEARIQAWLNLQTAKAEAQSRKLEVKIQKMRSNLEEKLMKRMSIVHRKAEEWRATAQVEHSNQIKKANKSAKKLTLNHHQSSSHLSSHIISCGCFPCNSN